MTSIHFAASRGGPREAPLHLMPFHIAYDGPAPLSTYFLVHPDSAPDGPSQEQVNPSRVQRFISTFRGRALKGTHIPLPDGYTGVLLRSSAPAAPKAKPPARPTPTKRRPGPSSKKRAASPIPIPVPDSDDEAEQAVQRAEEERPRKELRVDGVFRGFVLWGADGEADEEDAYVRALGEWRRLAELIHDTSVGATV
ncbi:ribonuclease H1 small subunit [Calocera cornea HHB12733]|uniref:Ribonuclease H1 small subunit n=1 Tax=Calocera cornea HHB12733 TaxID=1353952 RepID=A0A165FK54_9BASI|nr:ribonuclease H1 small subunit [Calocera cornea HHB12733]